MKRSTFARLALLVGVLTVLLALQGCGGDDGVDQSLYDQAQIDLDAAKADAAAAQIKADEDAAAAAAALKKAEDDAAAAQIKADEDAAAAAAALKKAEDGRCGSPEEGRGRRCCCPEEGRGRRCCCYDGGSDGGVRCGYGCDDGFWQRLGCGHGSQGCEGDYRYSADRLNVGHARVRSSRCCKHGDDRVHGRQGGL